MAEWGGAKRFYKKAEPVATDAGFTVALDGRPVKTPAGSLLELPSERLAASVSAEWSRQGERIDPNAMPLCRLAATAIDRVALRREEVIAVTLKFAETDLLCYRAGEPPELVARQARAWEPLLDWSLEITGERMIVTEGVVPVSQPAAVLRNFEDHLDRLDAFRLTGLSGAAASTGSLVLGFALSVGRIDAAQAAELSLLDGIFQMEQWGEDQESLARQERIRAELKETAQFLDMLS